MMASCAGFVPVTGKLTLILPLNATGLTVEMFNCGSELMTDQAVSSIAKVNEPAASFRLAMVSVTAVGVGV